MSTESTNSTQDTSSNETPSPAPAPAPAADTPSPAPSEGTSSPAPAPSSETPAPAPVPAPAPEPDYVTADTTKMSPDELQRTESEIQNHLAAVEAKEFPAETMVEKVREDNRIDGAPNEHVHHHVESSQQRVENVGPHHRVVHAAAAAPTPAYTAPEIPTVADANPLVLALQRDLTNYASAMAPAKRILPQAGAAAQMALWSVLVRILNLPQTSFQPVWTYMLSFAYENRDGVWNDRLLHRFISDMGLSPRDLRMFERIRHLISMTADPKSRATALKQVNLPNIIASMTSIVAQQNLMGYYSV